MTGGHGFLPNLMQRAAAEPGQKLRFFDDTGLRYDLDHAEFLRCALRFAVRLRDLGVRPGQAVAIRGGATAPVAIAIVGTALSGALVVPVVHLLGPADVDFILGAVEARVLVSPDQWRKFDYRAHLDEVERRRGVASVLRLDAEILLSPSGPPETQPMDEDDEAPAFVLFTSGTTSRPKGAIHTRRSLMAECHDFAGQLGLSPGGVFLQSFPLGHIGGLAGLFMPILLGFDGLFLDRWDPGIAFDAIERFGVTAMGSTPYFVETLLELRTARGGGLASLRSVMSGGASVTEALVRRADAVGIRMHRSYGMTEHPTVTSSGADAPLDVRARTDGWPTSESQIRIVGADGCQVASGTGGEILVRGPEQFLGYLGDGSAVAADGWFATGDIGLLRDDGTLVVTGRKKDIIIRGGENISALEVETALLRQDGVGAAAVIGVADPRLGERVYAFVVAPGCDPSDGLQRVRDHFRDLGLAAYKTPEWVEVVEDLPRNALGKVQKYLLRPRLLPSGQNPTTESGP